MLDRYKAVVRIVIAVLLACLTAGITTNPASAADIIVNSTADPGDGTCDVAECTLREAIVAANTAPGLDTISFNISPAGAETIFPESSLPAITDPVTVDGTSQPGFMGQPIIEIAGTYAGGGSGLIVTAGGSTLRGLVINRFSDAGILLISDGNTVAGNYIGTSLDGNGPSSNANGVRIDGGDYNLIGGTTPADRNVISANTANGVSIVGGSESPYGDCDDNADDDGDGAVNDGCPRVGSLGESGVECGNALNDDPGDDTVVNDGCPAAKVASGNSVLGNYIGVNPTGTSAVMPHSLNIGVRIDAGRSNLIGGIVPGSENVISSHYLGVYLNEANQNLIRGNLIGTDVTGSTAIGNAYEGVFVSGLSNIVGGDTPAARNIISGNGNRGVSINGIFSSGNVVTGNFIGTDISGTSALGNSGPGVHLNASRANSVGGVGPGEGNIIAFNGSGVDVSGTPTPGTPIRGNSIHSNTGKGIAHYTSPAVPVVQGATTNSASGTACAGCAVDVFSDDQDEGRIYHGWTVADPGGNWSFSGAIAGLNVTATATSTYGETSEFSAPRALPDPATDVDGDGILNTVDNCPNVANPGQENLDGDSLGDVCDPDDDNDGVGDGVDNCPVVANASQQDGDGDGVGNACDNCPSTANANQANLDGDAQGDACDTDDDGDGVDDIVDNCPAAANSNQANADGDTTGDVCDPDGDNDDIPNQLDPCPLLQDCDGDGVYDIGDNCPTTANASQQDSDGDAIGDPCEPCAGAPTDCIDGFSLDLEEDASPANTPTSLGSREPCRRVNNNGVLDADEDLVDALVVDVVVGPVGVPGGRPLIGFDFRLDYDATKVSIAALDVRQIIAANPGSDIYDVPSDDPPESDGTLYALAVDTGTGVGETGDGVFARITVEAANQAPGFTTLTLRDAGVVDDLNTGVQIVSVYAGAIALDTTCDVPDGDGDGLPDPADNCPSLLNPDQADNEHDGIGNVCDPDDDNAGVYDADEMSCGANPFVAAIRPEWTFGAFAGADDDGDTMIDEALPPGAENYDCDGDGYKGSAESGTPLCGNGVNDDDRSYPVFPGPPVADDAVIDDGCPGGPAQVGTFSEAQFNIGGNDQDPCGLGSWPSDFITGGFPDSTNKINITDLTSFIAPPESRRLDTAPGQPTFDKRWDLIPGRGVFNNMINVTDLTSLIAGSSGNPPMLGGVKAFNGPACPWAP